MVYYRERIYSIGMFSPILLSLGSLIELENFATVKILYLVPMKLYREVIAVVV